MRHTRRDFIKQGALWLPAIITARKSAAGTLILGRGAQTSNGMATGLYAAFELDEAIATAAAVDSVSGGTAMTAVNSPTVNAAKLGSASRGFNGSNMRFTRAESALNGLTAYTVSAWVKPASVASNQRAVAQDHVSGTRGWLLGVNSSGKALFSVANTTSLNTCTGTATTLTTTKWYLLIGVFDGANVSVYVGAEDAGTFPASSDGPAAPFTGTPASPSAQMAIGCNYTTGTSAANLFNGSIDAVRIWTRALNSTERAFEFNGGTGRTFSEYN
jgi:hypothetical protein